MSKEREMSLIGRFLEKNYPDEKIGTIYAKDHPVFLRVRESLEAEGGLPMNFPYTLMELASVGDHYLAMFSGGNNGKPDWPAYLANFSKIMLQLERMGYKPWLVNVNNDCPDDIHYIIIGLREWEFKCKDIEEDPDLKGWGISDEKDEWGALKVRVYIDGMDNDMWRRIKRYVSSWDGWSANDLRSGWFYLYSSFYSIKDCPKGEYKLHIEILDRLVDDLKAMFPHVKRRGPIYKKYYEF